MSNPEVYEGEGVHIQCLVEYSDPNPKNVVVEIRRTLFNTSEIQSLSSNGHVLLSEPRGQKYEAYVVNHGSKSQEHAFKIQNIHDRLDSGMYQCLIKSNGRVLDSKQTRVQVYLEDYNQYNYDLLDGAARLFEPQIINNEEFEAERVQELATKLPDKDRLKCKRERQEKPDGKLIQLSFE